MEPRSLAKQTERMPSFFDDYFKPWNNWFENGGLLSRVVNIPAVNISEQKGIFMVSIAAPGLKKDDFKINLEGNMLTISSEKEENKEDNDQRFTRKEYSYSSFSRSFTLPEEVNKEKIEAKYEDGILKISLPRKEEAKNLTAQSIAVK